MRLTFLGTGTSFGVPQIGCACAVCRSPDPRDRRTRVGALVEADMKTAGEAGVGGTPSFYINGQTFDGNPTVAGLSEAIDAELARAKG